MSTTVQQSENNLCIEVGMQLEEVDKGVQSDSFGDGQTKVRIIKMRARAYARTRAHNGSLD